MDHFCVCQEVLPSFTEEDIERSSKKKELDELRKNNIQQKGFTGIEKRECEWWRVYKANNFIQKRIR